MENRQTQAANHRGARAVIGFEDRAVRNVAEAVERCLVGAREGGHVENQLWPACRAVGVSRSVFDRAIEVLETQRRVERSYDRIYVSATRPAPRSS